MLAGASCSVDSTYKQNRGSLPWRAPQIISQAHNSSTDNAYQGTSKFHGHRLFYMATTPQDSLDHNTHSFITFKVQELCELYTFGKAYHTVKAHKSQLLWIALIHCLFMINNVKKLCHEGATRAHGKHFWGYIKCIGCFLSSKS